MQATEKEINIGTELGKRERLKNHEESMHVGCQIGLHPGRLTWNPKMEVDGR